MEAKDFIAGYYPLLSGAKNGNLTEGDYEEIIGIDAKEGLEAVFAEQLGDMPIRYRQMDAVQIGFAVQARRNYRAGGRPSRDTHGGFIGTTQGPTRPSDLNRNHCEINPNIANF